MDLQVSTENEVTALREEKVPARSPHMTQFLTPKSAGRGPDSLKEGARNEVRPLLARVLEEGWGQRPARKRDTDAEGTLDRGAA